MIRNVQDNTVDVIGSMKEINDKVDKGIYLANDAGKVLEKIMKSSGQLLDMNSQMAASSEEQSLTNRKILESLMRISSVTSNASGKINLISSSGKDLNQLTHNLKSLAGNFKTN